ncbi:MAG: S1 RNA-binding domain-containing protein, partial [Spirochaetales bacterium]|nr:S1 RNA-binding domain-containing protein [Spirochaetales bacterium]
MNKLEPGQLIEAEIVSISGDCIFLQLSGKSEGQLDAAEMTDKDGNLTVNEGDTIKAYFLSSQNGEMHFTTKISGDKAGKAVLENAFESGIPIEGTVEKEIKGGFEIKIGDSRAFCPYSQIGQKRVENTEAYIGQHLTFKILEYSENGRNILVSNRAILKEEQKTQIEILKKTLHENMNVKGTVKSLQDFGAFVEISGVQTLLPISEISRSRVDDIHQSLSVGQEIEAAVIKLDWKNERITLSMKKLLSDPWDEAHTKYKSGSKHTGEVVRITNFGAFV